MILYRFNVGAVPDQTLGRIRGNVEMNRYHSIIQLLVASSFFVGGGVMSEEPMLVLTAEEFEANLSYRERGVSITKKPADPLAPEIIIERPDLASEVAAPVDIAIRFRTSDDAAIDLDTLKIHYGWFDITERVLKTMKVSPDGIRGKIRSMKNGQYSLKLSIRDTMRRRSDAKIVLRIVDIPGDE
jgi:hypothetical protein